ncbi:MAG: DNRLRE domain-containing protein [Nocardioidaceae bacterium]
MSTSKTILLSAYSVQSAKPTTAFGLLAVVPLRVSAAGMMTQVSLAGIPKNATITSAFVRVNVAQTLSGSWTASVYRRTDPWPGNVTWNNRGTLSSAVGSVTVAAPKKGAAFDIPVTSTIQQMVAGTLTNRGLYVTLATASGSNIGFYGPKAGGGRPALYVTYTVAPAAPTNLEPSDAVVADPTPTLLFNTDPSILGLQVQADPAANGTTPAFNSGDVTATAGLLDLGATSFVPLANGASTMWRARQRTDGGWSAWSGWVPFTYAVRPSLTITSPSGTPDVNGRIPVNDGTPPVVWSFTGTQVAWRARLIDDTGKVLADSQRIAGTDTTWTPPAGLTADSQVGVLEVTVWDNSARVAVEGQPAENIAQLNIVLSPDGTITAFTGTTATHTGWEPVVTVTGHRTAIPDEVALDRDGREVARYPGASVMVAAAGGGFNATVTDIGARMNRSHTWSLRPIVNSKKGPVGPVASDVPRCQGVWLYNADKEPVVLWATDAGDHTQAETAVVHQPLGANLNQPPVRRRLVRATTTGNVSGLITEILGWSALVMEQRLRDWVEEDAGAVYTLIFGNYAGAVIIGDVTFSETSPGRDPDGNPEIKVSYNYWDTGRVV